MTSIYLSARNTFFVSDTHFCHKNAAKMRGFVKTSATGIEGDSGSMDEELIRRWNATVPEGFLLDSTVVIIGDFSFAGGKRTTAILERLNGRRKILVRGNHDKGMQPKTLEYFESVHDILTVKIHDPTEDDPEHVQRMVCCHYPMLAWDMGHHGAWMLHGHSHGTCRYPIPNARILDVGVDCVPGMRPLSFEFIKGYMKDREARVSDYHDRSTK